MGRVNEVTDVTVLDGRGREAERERRPGADHALRNDVATHPARELAADREPQPHALVRPRQLLVDLDERLENGGQLLRRDPDARVRDCNLDVVCRCAHATRTCPSGSVNLIAFESRLSRICCTFSRSARALSVGPILAVV